MREIVTLEIIGEDLKCVFWYWFSGTNTYESFSIIRRQVTFLKNKIVKK